MVCGSNGLHGVLPWPRPIDHDIGQVDFLGQRHLASDSPDGFSAKEAITFLEAGDLGFAVGRDDDGMVDSLFDASFEEERYVVDDDCTRVFSRSLFRQSSLFTGDARMDDMFELPAFFCVAEDDASESLSVERAVLIEDGLPEERDDLSPGRPTWFDGLMGQFVGIDHDRAALLEHLGNGAFSGRDAACEAD